MLTIIDSSVAVKWFVADDEPRRKQALAVLEDVCAAPNRFAVPELFFNEMLAVFCRLLNDSSKIKENMRMLEQLGFERIGNGSKLLERAAEIAKEYKISGYDAIFAATASLTEGLWLTADEAAIKKLKSADFVKLL